MWDTETSPSSKPHAEPFTTAPTPRPSLSRVTSPHSQGCTGALPRAPPTQRVSPDAGFQVGLCGAVTQQQLLSGLS